jgi:hypothetical protein
MYEFENPVDFEKCFNKVMQDEEFMTTIYAKFTSHVVPSSESADVWNSAM